jgi:hypothetical protein
LIHNDEQFTIVMSSWKRQKLGTARLTISLGERQRQELEAIAQTNHSSLAFVIRHALNHFIVEHKDKQLRLNIPE